MFSDESLFVLPAIPASLLSLAACKGDKEVDTTPEKKQVEAPAPENVTSTPKETVADPNACVATDAKKVAGALVCTDAKIAEHTGKFDGFSCFYESCALPENKDCPPEYEPRAVSVPPQNVVCTFSNPMDL